MLSLQYYAVVRVCLLASQSRIDADESARRFVERLRERAFDTRGDAGHCTMALAEPVLLGVLRLAGSVVVSCVELLWYKSQVRGGSAASLASPVVLGRNQATGTVYLGAWSARRQYLSDDWCLTRYIWSGPSSLGLVPRVLGRDLGRRLKELFVFVVAFLARA